MGLTRQAGFCALHEPCVQPVPDRLQQEQELRSVLELSMLGRVLFRSPLTSRQALAVSQRRCIVMAAAPPSKVAVVGAGLAGAACSSQLAVQGMTVSIFDMGGRGPGAY